MNWTPATPLPTSSTTAAGICATAAETSMPATCRTMAKTPFIGFAPSTLIASRQRSIRGLIDLPGTRDVPALTDERFTGETIGEPIGKEDRRKRAEIGSRHIADRMARFLINHHLLRALECRHQALGMFERAQFFRFAGNAKIGHADFFGMTLPGDGLAEFVELILVGDATHIHESLFERRRGFLENRVAARLMTYRHHCAGFDARLVAGEHGAEQRAKARPSH